MKEYSIEVKISGWEFCNVSPYGVSYVIDRKIQEEVDKFLKKNNLKPIGKGVVCKSHVVVDLDTRFFVTFNAEIISEDEKYRECVDYFLENCITFSTK